MFYPFLETYQQTCLVVKLSHFFTINAGQAVPEGTR